MQAGRGGGNGPGMTGKDGLVIGLILRVGRTFGGDIGRQRHQSGFCQGCVEIIAREVKFQMQVGFRFCQNLRRQLIRKNDHLAHHHFAQRLGKRPPARCQWLQQGDFHLCHHLTPPAMAKQPRRDHAGVVQDQPITGAKDVNQIRHMSVGDRWALRHQQPRRCARNRWPRGDQRLGQVKIKIRKFHPPLSFNTGAGLRKISRNMPGVMIDSGFTPISGSSAVPRRV